MGEVSNSKKVTRNMELVCSTSINVLPGLERMVDKVDAQKKVKVDVKEIRSTLSNLYDVIKYFNSIDEYTTLVFGGVDIHDVKILKEFSDFIVPAAVRFDPTDLRSKNLAKREGVVSAPFSYVDYVNLCDTFRGYFKKDASTDTVSLSDLKKSQNLTSVIDKASNQRNDSYVVNYGTQVYYPIRLDDISILYEDRHFNASESDLMSDYLSYFRF